MRLEAYYVLRNAISFGASLPTSTACGTAMWMDVRAVCLLLLGILRRRRMIETGKAAWTEYRAPFTLTDTLWRLLFQRVGDAI